jgi:hypothetical protein
VDAVFTRNPSSSYKSSLTLTWAGPLPQQVGGACWRDQAAAELVLPRTPASEELAGGALLAEEARTFGKKRRSEERSRIGERDEDGSRI